MSIVTGERALPNSYNNTDNSDDAYTFEIYHDYFNNHPASSGYLLNLIVGKNSTKKIHRCIDNMTEDDVGDLDVDLLVRYISVYHPKNTLILSKATFYKCHHTAWQDRVKIIDKLMIKKLNLDYDSVNKNLLEILISSVSSLSDYGCKYFLRFVDLLMRRGHPFDESASDKFLKDILSTIYDDYIPDVDSLFYNLASKIETVNSNLLKHLCAYKKFKETHTAEVLRIKPQPYQNQNPVYQP